MNNLQTLSREEEIIFTLRELYARYGYTSYKMSKFEDYELYARNKDFLVSDNVITFNDMGGRLMALKPDVTLSIVKNSTHRDGTVQKVYYNENVYRVSARTHRFSEIMQTGLECIGDLDGYCVGEVLMLAAKSLKTVSEQAVLDVSHMGVVSALLEKVTERKELRDALLHCLNEKNVHELKALCEQNGISETDGEPLCRLVTAYGKPETVLPELLSYLEGKIDVTPLEELRQVTESLPKELKDILRVDFSVVNDLSYYNGLVFKGFVPGVPGSILSGGRYDRLLRKMGRPSGAMGFAVYMDELGRLDTASAPYDVDTVLLYSRDTDVCLVRDTVETLREEGTSVLAQREMPEKLRVRRVLRLSENGEVTTL